MSLGQDFLSGFQTTSGAAFAYKDRKRQAQRDSRFDAEREADRALRMERQILEDARYEDQLTRQQERQIVEDARYDQQRQSVLERDARDFAFTKDRAVSADLRATSADARQARQDFSNEITQARRDPLQEDIMVQQARRLKLEADAIGQPRPMQATERLEYDPYDPEGPPRRIVTGPLGSLDGVAPRPAAPAAPAAQPTPAAIEYLLRDPQNLAPAFDAKYGPGAAQRALSR
jgi:hypothetical protein